MFTVIYKLQHQQLRVYLRMSPTKLLLDRCEKSYMLDALTFYPTSTERIGGTKKTISEYDDCLHLQL